MQFVQSVFATLLTLVLTATALPSRYYYPEYNNKEVLAQAEARAHANAEAKSVEKKYTPYKVAEKEGRYGHDGAVYRRGFEKFFNNQNHDENLDVNNNNNVNWNQNSNVNVNSNLLENFDFLRKFGIHKRGYPQYHKNYDYNANYNWDENKDYNDNLNYNLNYNKNWNDNKNKEKEIEKKVYYKRQIIPTGCAPEIEACAQYYAPYTAVPAISPAYAPSVIDYTALSLPATVAYTAPETVASYTTPAPAAFPEACVEIENPIAPAVVDYTAMTAPVVAPAAVAIN